MLRRPGLFVVLLGPDGAGKSTIARRLEPALDREFAGSWRFHWRPKLLPKLGRQPSRGRSNAAPASTPPTRAAYGSFVSLLRFVYYWADFVLGYWLKIRPRRHAGLVVIGERYFPDVLVHPDRYGFALPVALMRAFGWLVPAPDVTILLRAEPELIFSRKGELSVELIRAQLSAYERAMAGWGRRLIVDTGTGVESSVATILEALVGGGSPDRWSHPAPTRRVFPRIGRPRLLLAPWPAARHAYQMAIPTVPSAATFAVGAFSQIPLLHRIVEKRIPHVPPATSSGILPPPESDELIREVVGCRRAHVNYFLGHPGPRRKITAQVVDGDRVIAYVKMGASMASRLLVRAESGNLDDIRDRFHSASVPARLGYVEADGWTYLALSAPPEDTRRRDFAFERCDRDFLAELTGIGARRVSMTEMDRMHSLTARLECIPTDDGFTWIRSMAEAALERLHAATGNGLQVGWAHCDYAPWNTRRLRDGSLYVFDWEYMQRAVPVLHDACHYLRIPSHLVKKVPPDVLAAKLLHTRGPLQDSLREAAAAVSVEAGEVEVYVLAYLLLQLLHHAGTDGGGAEALARHPGQAKQMAYLAGVIDAVLGGAR